MNILAWIVLGLIAGAIAKMIYPGQQGGNIISTILLGIVGAFIGGSIYTLLTTGTLALTSAGFSIGGLIVSVIGAIICLWLYYTFTRRAY
ncbi:MULTISPECIES: GlsB/YeaQ/YmgE family stress response membrane protein [Calothrix]|uniref:GlsB/YeaQ/YmgE family stress response membrane protein n=2 Tax=Calothrix TaxID=1186 RepID=A0ABR8ADA0_9CYAN|nr:MULTISPECIES: GlsB/YeaQ/YmgE family stress response membrane protein [Calothrix]MBD2197719.1 GlsB/YeaQ/YmgE family stress response membrane protein [Calothrix parietina FACHB-288]MBD2205347.1 GlsB/YeaQ/YmgE family stress response membrane protein [Calothrix sp. FACHB-168]MBD2218478.1 GlsB/YeaQ/YmgE family stress response membrane protein [Calothrix sp. FACHB-1219]MBD2225648.1 GlsB/YeaQ/YmgE family stress response membrane protein [Calothrix anomala FACHB-343]